MIEGKKVLAIIPARKGSKGLPGKNIKLLCGKPLVSWTIEKALLSNYIDELIISTDCKKIAKIAEKLGCKVPFLRPKSLSDDKTPMYKVILHALKYYEKKNIFFDIIVLLEPTSPLRENNDIDKMLEKLCKNYDKFDSIISIGKVEEHPSLMKRLSGENILPYCENLDIKSRRQDNNPAYFPYGVAYISKVKSFKKKKTFYTNKTTFYEIKRYQNYEIDSIYDFLAVENIMKYVWGLI